MTEKVESLYFVQFVSFSKQMKRSQFAFHSGGNSSHVLGSSLCNAKLTYPGFRCLDSVLTNKNNNPPWKWGEGGN